MTTCAYCGTNPPIENSHVVPAFIVRYLKKNSPEKFIMNSWALRTIQDALKGPYLCGTCDNVTFSAWESHFKRAVFDPVLDGKAAAWSDEASIRFVLAVVFRYMVHFLETSPVDANRQQNADFRDLTKEALGDLTVVGANLFIYPYQYRPIVSKCGFTPGVNHFLQLSFHCVTLPTEDNLPRAVALFLPEIIVLMTDKSLAGLPDCDLVNPESLIFGSTSDFASANLAMPKFLRVLINRGVGQTMANQKAAGLWGEIDYGGDKLAHPDRQLYIAQARDSELQAWQRANCRNGDDRGNQ